MCFIRLKDGKGDLPLIAGDDISVWKILRHNYKSKHIGFKYERGVLHSTDMVILDIDTNKNIPSHNDVLAGLSLEYELRKIYKGGEWDSSENFDWRYLNDVHKHLLCIEIGFHSYFTEDRLPTYIYDKHYIKRLDGDGDIAVEFIIPKGSEYYLDNSGLAVSNKIIMTNHLK